MKRRQALFAESRVARIALSRRMSASKCRKRITRATGDGADCMPPIARSMSWRLANNARRRASVVAADTGEKYNPKRAAVTLRTELAAGRRTMRPRCR